MEYTTNTITVRGTLLALPQYSHNNHGKQFYRFTLEVPRLSGAVDLLPVVADGLDWFVWLPAATAAFCLVTVLLTAELPPEDLDAVTELRDVVLLPMTPREELLLVPTPLLTVVFPLSVNTRSSLCVSWRGPYHILLEKCPPCPRPGPPWMCP